MPYADPQKKRAFRAKRNLKKRGATKECADCHEVKPESEFLKKNDRPRQRNRRSSYCHRCRIHRHRLYGLRTKYGLTKEAFDVLMLAQGGVCAICNRERTDNRNLCVDHDHRTGAVRGLLCVPCNALLGNAQESPELLKRAIEYLRAHSNATGWY